MSEGEVENGRITFTLHTQLECQANDLKRVSANVGSAEEIYYLSL